MTFYNPSLPPFNNNSQCPFIPKLPIQMQASLHRPNSERQFQLYSSRNRSRWKIRTICHYWPCKKQKKTFSPSKSKTEKCTEHHPHYTVLPLVSTYMPNSHFRCKLEITPDNKAFLSHSQGTLVPKVISANLFQLLLILSAHRFLCRDRCYSKLLLPLPRLLLRRTESCHCNYYLKFFSNLYQPFPSH